MAADRSEEAPQAWSPAGAEGRAQPELVGRDHQDRPRPSWEVTGRGPSDPKKAVGHNHGERLRFGPVPAIAPGPQEPHRVLQPYRRQRVPNKRRRFGHTVQGRPRKHACRGEPGEYSLAAGCFEPRAWCVCPGPVKEESDGTATRGSRQLHDPRSRPQEQLVRSQFEALDIEWHERYESQHPS